MNSFSRLLIKVLAAINSFDQYISLLNNPNLDPEIKRLHMFFPVTQDVWNRWSVETQTKKIRELQENIKGLPTPTHSPSPTRTPLPSVALPTVSIPSVLAARTRLKTRSWTPELMRDLQKKIRATFPYVGHTYLGQSGLVINLVYIDGEGNMPSDKKHLSGVLFFDYDGSLGWYPKKEPKTFGPECALWHGKNRTMDKFTLFIDQVMR